MFFPLVAIRDQRFTGSARYIASQRVLRMSGANREARSHHRVRW